MIVVILYEPINKYVKNAIQSINKPSDANPSQVIEYIQ